MFNILLKTSHFIKPNKINRAINLHRPIYKFISMDSKTPTQEPTGNTENAEKLSKNALKKQQKMQQKEQEKAQKVATKPEAPIKKAKEDEAGEITDANEYYDFRVKQVTALKADKDNFPYPHKFHVSHPVSVLRAEFLSKCTESGIFLPDEISTAGRVLSIRSAGKNLIFFDIEAEDAKIQIMGNLKEYHCEKHFEHIKTHIKRGDHIGVRGTIGLSKTGEFSILPKYVQLLAPCLHMLPKAHYGLTDVETRYRKRYLDLIVNNRTREIFKIRSQVIAILRNELNKRGFLEVETPTLNLIPGGATAKPFDTFHNDLHQKMFLRIAPELFLKNCIVGGLHKVFEIGKNFRNEGIDQTHNPEFTACELYWAYVDYTDLMTFTEEILSTIVLAIKGSYKFDIIDDNKQNVTIDFTPPFRRINMMEELEKVLGEKCPEDLESEEANKFFDAQCAKHKVVCSNPRTTSRLIDKLVGHLFEPDCVSPTFLCEHPQLMCPLAKYHRSKPGLTERFELFINRKEFVNAYTELNDPFIQMEQFQEQMKNKAKGDEEANEIDWEFVKCLEHGLPPTGGWGLGIDRLIMLLTGSMNIQEVIMFPAMRPIKEAVVTEEEKKVQAEANGDKNKAQ